MKLLCSLLPFALLFALASSASQPTATVKIAHESLKDVHQAKSSFFLKPVPKWTTVHRFYLGSLLCAGLQFLAADRVDVRNKALTNGSLCAGISESDIQTLHYIYTANYTNTETAPFPFSFENWSNSYTRRDVWNWVHSMFNIFHQNDAEGLAKALYDHANNVDSFHMKTKDLDRFKALKKKDVTDLLKKRIVQVRDAFKAPEDLLFADFYPASNKEYFGDLLDAFGATDEKLSLQGNVHVDTIGLEHFKAFRGAVKNNKCKVALNEEDQKLRLSVVRDLIDKPWVNEAAYKVIDEALLDFEKQFVEMVGKCLGLKVERVLEKRPPAADPVARPPPPAGIPHREPPQTQTQTPPEPSSSGLDRQTIFILIVILIFIVCLGTASIIYNNYFS